MMQQLFPVALLLSFVTLSSQQSHGQPSHNQHQQQQQQHGHGHGHGHQDKPLQFSSEIHNADHILEHLQSVVATKSKDQMTEEELEFHYFKLHDYDNNNKLDGVEIGKALTHFHDESDPPAEKDGTKKVFEDSEISNIVDSVITENDENGDGYIEYFEFKSRQAASRQQQQQHRKEPPPT